MSFFGKKLKKYILNTKISIYCEVQRDRDLYQHQSKHVQRIQ